MKPLSSNCVTYFDFLRFFLAQIVVVGHGFGFYFGYWNGFFPLRAPYIQSIAVVGFFFVSGFLICRSVLSNFEYKGGDYIRYFVDRFARIYTALVPCLIFVWLTDYMCMMLISGSELQAGLTVKAFLKNLSLVSSIPYGTMRPVWSLMFEWWLYVLFGGIVFFRKNVVVSLICICLGGYYTFHVNSQGDAGHIEVIWFFGAVSAFLFDKMVRVSGAKYIAVIAFLAAAIGYMTSLDAYNIVAGLFFSAGLLFVAVACNSSGVMSESRVSSVFSSLAGYSFTLFLTHYTVLFWLQKYGFSGVGGLGVSLLLSNIIAYVLGYFTESYHKAISGKLLESISIWRSKLAARHNG